MDTIIDELYYGRINEEERQLPPTEYDERLQIAEKKLMAVLPHEAQKAFNEFFNLYHCRDCEYRKESYSRGLKTGLKLGMEAGIFAADYQKENSDNL